MLGECFRRGGRKSEMEKKDERIANLERLLGKREFKLDWQSKKAKELGLLRNVANSWIWVGKPLLANGNVSYWDWLAAAHTIRSALRKMSQLPSEP